jgi:hypothetical protein
MAQPKRRLILAMTTFLALIPATCGQETESQVMLSDFEESRLIHLLGEFVDVNGLVNYQDLLRKRTELDTYATNLAQLPRSTYEEWTSNQKIAFWINAYNVLTLKVIIDHYPIKGGGWLASLRFPQNSIRQIDGAWDGITHTVMGQSVTLDRIEHEILRKEFDEPRIHMALVCAALGCPNLRIEPYVGTRLDNQLEDQTRTFLADSGKFHIDRKAGVVHLSSIFDWFGDDFAPRYATTEFQQADASIRPVLAFIADHLSADDAQYLVTGTYKVRFLDYDWELNERG